MEKKKIVLDRICRVLTSKKDETSECILGQDARRIVESWFETQNSQFAGKTPMECLDMEFEQLLEYVDYLDSQFLLDLDATSCEIAAPYVRRNQAT